MYLLSGTGLTRTICDTHPIPRKPYGPRLVPYPVPSLLCSASPGGWRMDIALKQATTTTFQILTY